MSGPGLASRRSMTATSPSATSSFFATRRDDGRGSAVSALRRRERGKGFGRALFDEAVQDGV